MRVAQHLPRLYTNMVRVLEPLGQGLLRQRVDQEGRQERIYREGELSEGSLQYEVEWKRELCRGRSEDS